MRQRSDYRENCINPQQSIQTVHVPFSTANTSQQRVNKELKQRCRNFLFFLLHSLSSRLTQNIYRYKNMLMLTATWLAEWTQLTNMLMTRWTRGLIRPSKQLNMCETRKRLVQRHKQLFTTVHLGLPTWLPDHMKTLNRDPTSSSSSVLSKNVEGYHDYSTLLHLRWF